MSLVGDLNTLESAGLLHLASTSPDLEYLFRHALVQEATYASLPELERQRLHRAVGETLEEIYAGRLDELAPELARHFHEAGDASRAARYYMLAADSALAGFANQEAEQTYRCAIEMAETETEHARGLFGLGTALQRLSRFSEALSVWREASEIYRRLGLPDRVALCYARMARAAWHDDKWPHGLQLALEGLELVADAPEGSELAELIHEAGRAFAFNEKPDEAAAYCKRALEMAQHLGVVHVQSEALSTLGLLPNQPPDAVEQQLREAVRLAEAAELLSTATRAYVNLAGFLFKHYADIRAAREHTARAVAAVRRLGIASQEFTCLMQQLGYSMALGDRPAVEQNLLELRRSFKQLPNRERAIFDLKLAEARVLYFRGELDQAAGQLQELLNQSRARQDRELVGEMCYPLAEVLIDLQQYQLAEQLLQEALEYDQRKGTHIDAWIWLQQARIYAQIGRNAEARRLADLVSNSQEVYKYRLVQIRLDHVRALAAAGERNWDTALNYFELVAGELLSRESHCEYAHLLHDWADALVARGEPVDFKRARALLREAQELFERLNLPGWAARMQERHALIDAAVYTREMASLRARQELVMAGRIQAGLLPADLPVVPGWQIEALLLPARETAGDFYDLISLPDGRLGIVIADVADKGAGAALYMALSRTLIRTFAAEQPLHPERVLEATNRRILRDTHADLFITAFYGVLDPQRGLLTYANAGHNPPLLQTAEQQLRELRNTGVALGVVEDTSWTQVTLRMQPGDQLLLYTDGVTEALNEQDQWFGAERLMQILATQRGRSARELRDTVMAELRSFVGNTPQVDDITLMVLARIAL